jgi:hypothetical protein
VRLRRRHEDRDLAHAGGERGVEAAAVGHQARQDHAVSARHAARDLGGVGQLRDPLRADEAGDLDPRQAAVDQRGDERDLVGGRDVARLVLQAVAGPDLVHGDARRELHADARTIPRGDRPRHLAGQLDGHLVEGVDDRWAAP